MSEPVSWNRAERRRRGMTRSRMKRTGSLASAGVLVSAGLFGAYVGNPRLQRAYASPAVCSGAVTVTGPGDDTLVAALDDSTVTCIEIQGQITLSADLPVITDDSWSGGPRDSALGLTLYGVGGDDTINGYDGADYHGGLAILLANPLDDTVSLNLSGLTMTNLQATYGGAISLDVSGPGKTTYLYLKDDTFSRNEADYGGAIWQSKGQAVIQASTFTGNSSDYYGGAIFGSRVDVSGGIFTDNSSDSYGGAIYSKDVVSIDDGTEFIGNDAKSGGAIFENTNGVDVSGGIFKENSSVRDGGAIYSHGVVSIDNDTEFIDNDGRSGGAIFGTDRVDVSGGIFTGNSSVRDGGAVYAYGRVYVSGVTFTGNSSGDDGGAISGADPVYADNGTQFLDNEAASSGGAISADDTVDVSGVTFTENSSGGLGGAISSHDSVYADNGTQFLDNDAVNDGGAISADGRVDVSGVTFTENSSMDAGGAISSYDSVYADNGTQFLGNEAALSGGAISADDTIDVSGVTFTGNSSMDAGGAIVASFVNANDGTEFLRNWAYVGGAISAYRVGLDGVLIEGNAAHHFGGGVHVFNGLLTVSNSTIYGNTAVFKGGGIWSDDGAVAVSYSAIIGNRAVDDTNGAGAGGGIAAVDSHSEVLLTNTYVGGNQADDTAGGIYLPGAHSHLGLYFTTVYDDTVTSGGGHAEFDVHSLTAVGSAVGNEWSNNVWSATFVDDTYFVSTDQSSGAWTPGSGSVELGPGVGLGLGVRDDTVRPGHAGRTPLAGSPLITGAPSSFFGVLPAGDDQLGVSRVSPFTIGARQFVAPAPPPGPSGVVPSAPRDPRAVAGDRQAVVSWVEPVSSGSFPITDYEVVSVPSRGSCLVKVPSLSCTVSGLENGTSYVFRVRALNGAGWSPESVASNGVTPRPGPSILVTGTREGNRVRVRGATQGLTSSTVTPRYHFAGEVDYTTGVARPRIDNTGEFTWSRVAGRTIYVYFAADGTRSNRLVLRREM